MEVSRRRSTSRNGVNAGSIMESRMKIDEGKSGVKVLNGEENSEGVGEGGVALRVYRRLRRNQSGGVSEKKPVGVPERSPIQIRKTKSDSHRNSSDSSKDVGVTVDGIEKKSIQIRKTKSDSQRYTGEPSKEIGVSIEGIEKNPIQIKKTKFDSNKQLGESIKEPNVSVDGIEKNPIHIKNTRSDSQTSKELGVCREKIDSSNLSNVGQIENQGLVIEDDGADADEEDEGEEVEEEEESEMEIEEKSFDIKEINITEEPKKVVNEEKKIDQIHETPIPIAPNVFKRRIQVISHPVIDPKFKKPTPIAVSDEFERLQETQSKLQNIVDLVMWKDVSKSTFVFGFGSFILLSSSFTKDLNFSLISAISYMGLLYLAAIFFYKSILRRGNIETEESNQTYLVGEEEATWLLHLILPYLNGFLLKFKSLFSGDPATTLKLGVILFVLARCGSSITIWKMTKLGFFGVFIVPKVCSSYSTQLTAYGNFWIRRFRDAWASCSHKKAVAAAIFTLVWNLSSITARVWAAFILIVAVRYYQQQSLLKEEWEEEQVAVGGEDDSYKGDKGQRHESGPNYIEIAQEKKGL